MRNRVSGSGGWFQLGCTRIADATPLAAGRCGGTMAKRRNRRSPALSAGSSGHEPRLSSPTSGAVMTRAFRDEQSPREGESCTTGVRAKLRVNEAARPAVQGSGAVQVQPGDRLGDGVGSQVHATPPCARADAPTFIVVDDEPAYLRSIGGALEAYGNVHTARSASRARELIESLDDFSFALIDISLPEHDPVVPRSDEERRVLDAIRQRRVFDPLPPHGIAVARAARAKTPSATVMLFTARSEHELGDGADDLIDVPIARKPWSLDRALEVGARAAATHAVARGRIEAALADLTRVGLTRRALAVLDLLALGLPRTTIAEELDIEPSTVNVQVKKIVSAVRARCAGEAVDRILHRLHVAARLDEDLRREAAANW